MQLSSWLRRLIALVVSAALLAAPPTGVSFAQRGRSVGPTIAGPIPSPLPVGMTSPRVFHHTAVTPGRTLKLQWVDISIPAPGLPIVFERSFRGDHADDTGLGPGWSWSFGSRLGLDASTAAPAIREPNGERTRYRADTPHR